MKLSTSSHDEYLMKALKNPRRAANYLSAAYEDRDLPLFLEALQDVIEANGGFTRLAAKLQVSRPSLYKSLGERGHPQHETITRILQVLGLTFNIAPAGTRRRSPAHPHRLVHA